MVGQPNFTQVTTSVPPTATSLRGPEGVWVADGKLYIADTQDNRILIYNKIPTTNGVAADVVVGQPNFTTFVQTDLTKATPNPTAANMEDPVSVTTDGQRMYVTDLGQNRVLIYNTIPDHKRRIRRCGCGPARSGVLDLELRLCRSRAPRQSDLSMRTATRRD